MTKIKLIDFPFILELQHGTIQSHYEHWYAHPLGGVFVYYHTPENSPKEGYTIIEAAQALRNYCLMTSTEGWYVPDSNLQVWHDWVEALKLEPPKPVKPIVRVGGGGVQDSDDYIKIDLDLQDYECPYCKKELSHRTMRCPKCGIRWDGSLTDDEIDTKIRQMEGQLPQAVPVRKISRSPK